MLDLVAVPPGHVFTYFHWFRKLSRARPSPDCAPRNLIALGNGFVGNPMDR